MLTTFTSFSFIHFSLFLQQCQCQYIYNSFLVILKTVPLGFRMDNIPVINRLPSSLCYIPSEPDTAEGIEHRLIRIGNAKESLTQIVRFNRQFPVLLVKNHVRPENLKPV